MKYSLIPLLLIAQVAVASAGEVMHVVRGVDGLVRVPMTFTNAGSTAISCKSAMAHWYSLDLGTATKGAKLAVDLWADPKSGEVYLLNDKQDRMPIQSLWCGIEGRSWETRADVALERRAGQVPAAQNLVCTEADGRVRCKAG